MATPLVPGPCPVWVADSGGTPRFLGFSERGVSADFQYNYVPYHNDLGGAEPLDYSYQGKSATISLDLTRWRADTLAFIQDALSDQVGSTGGIDVPGEIGTLMAYEGIAFTVWTPYPYTNSPAYNTHPPGYRFPPGIIARVGRPARGSKPAKVHLVVRAIRQLLMTPATQTVFGAGRLTLYDHNMTAVAGLFPD
jgi:hypothetical protein